MKAMVTGGAGFLAGHLIEKLLQQGHQVRTVELPGRDISMLQKWGAEVVKGDLCDPQVCRRACEGMEVIYHLAALASPYGPREIFWAVNVGASDNLVEACKRAGVRRMVLISSAAVVCDGEEHFMVDETRPYSKRHYCHYSETKAVSEERVLAQNGPDLETCACRPHAVWGPRDTTLFPRIFARARQGRLVQLGSGENDYTLLYVENGVDALINAASAKDAPGRAYFLCDEKPVNLWGFIRRKLDGLKLPGPKARLPYPVAYALGATLEAASYALKRKSEPMLTRYMVVKMGKTHTYSNQRAQADLGYRSTVSVDQGLENVYAWIDEHGMPEAIG